MLEMQLSWQQGFSLSRKPAKRLTQRRKRQQRFEFVEEHPQIAYHTRRSPFVTTHSGSLSNSSREHPIIAETHGSYFHRETPEENGSLIDLSVGTLNNGRWIMGEGSPDLETINETTEPHLNPCNTEDQSISWRSPELATSEDNIAGPVPNATAVWALTDIPTALFASITPTIEYSSLTERFKPMLNRCMHLCTYSIFPPLTNNSQTTRSFARSH